MKKAACWLGLLSLLWGAGCSRQDAVDAALESDANGYLCLSCNAKFYTERMVFASKCPACRNPNIAQAVSFICAGDQQVNLGPRTVRAVPCQQCGKPATGLGLPREKDLQAWGASRKTSPEVN